MGIEELTRDLSALEKEQIPFATMQAMNRTAYAVAGLLSKKIERVFDRPTPWVIGAVRYTKATKRKLEATIDLDKWGNKQGVSVAQVLASEIEGGPRRLKRFERALIHAGVMRSNQSAVPGEGAKLDQYGNMSAGQIIQILSWFQTFGEQGYKANMADKTKARLAKGSRKKGTLGFEYFALQNKAGKLLPGIYQRFFFSSAGGSAVKPVLIFVGKRPTYKMRFDFYGYAEDRAYDEFRKEFPIALDEAMRTAR
ncbi:MAG: hypothetical protein A2143_08070 [Gallionellales bacterium RBG_16_57_15]|nr:MAG: hypothetical protein A2143_08070 [Gallionellales bacterium RBG_16_57_15]